MSGQRNAISGVLQLLPFLAAVLFAVWEVEIIRRACLATISEASSAIAVWCPGSLTQGPHGINFLTNEGCRMLLTLMVLCAVGAILIFGFEAFSDLSDAWSHPEHKGDEDQRHFPKSRAK